MRRSLRIKTQASGSLEGKTTSLNADEPPSGVPRNEHRSVVEPRNDHQASSGDHHHQPTQSKRARVSNVSASASAATTTANHPQPNRSYFAASTSSSSTTVSSVNQKVKLILWSNRDQSLLILREGTDKPVWTDYEATIGLTTDLPLLKRYISHREKFHEWIAKYKFNQIAAADFMSHEDDFFSEVERRFKNFVSEYKVVLDVRAEKKRYKEFFHYMRGYCRLVDFDERTWRLYYGYNYYTYLGKLNQPVTSDTLLNYSFCDLALLVKYSKTISKNCYQKEE